MPSTTDPAVERAHVVISIDGVNSTIEGDVEGKRLAAVRLALKVHEQDYYGPVPLSLRDIANATFAFCHALDAAIGDAASDHGITYTTGRDLNRSLNHITRELQHFLGDDGEDEAS